MKRWCRNLGLRSILKADTEGHTPKADESGDTREIRVTVFPTGGGRPYIRDVDVDSTKGTFTLADDETTYKIAKGSVWQEGTTERAIVHEGNPKTVNVDALGDDGDGLLGPKELHGIAETNLWEQLDEISRRKSPWQQSSTWVAMTFGVLALLLGLWLVKTTGDGFEQLSEAIRQMEIAAQSSSHQDISPNG